MRSHQLRPSRDTAGAQAGTPTGPRPEHRHPAQTHGTRLPGRGGSIQRLAPPTSDRSAARRGPTTGPPSRQVLADFGPDAEFVPSLVYPGPSLAENGPDPPKSLEMGPNLADTRRAVDGDLRGEVGMSPALPISTKFANMVVICRRVTWPSGGCSTFNRHVVDIRRPFANLQSTFSRRSTRRTGRSRKTRRQCPPTIFRQTQKQGMAKTR